MVIYVTDDSLIKDVQEAFNRCFPFLKVEVFRRANRFGILQRKLPMLPDQLNFGCMPGKDLPGKMEITPGMTVTELEKTCEEQFGLVLQVYRRSGNLWLETTMTNNWTIKQQNEQGIEISRL